MIERNQDLWGETFATGREAEDVEIPPAALGERESVRRGRRWGVLLAGGAGMRLQELTRFICGDDRPKQFCPLFGNQTLLEETRQRAERSIPAAQILVPVTRRHRAFYLQEPGIFPSQRIVQPVNKGTAPPILYSLLSIERIDDDAIVAILPCDHHFMDESAFTRALESAFDVAAAHSGSVVLLGATPHGPQVEYGWIDVGPSVGAAGDVCFRVRGFYEKPSLQVARELLERGSLWNTFVMVGHVRGFLEMVNSTLADIAGQLRGQRLWAGSEVHIPDSLYDRMPAADFSRDVLSAGASRLMALSMGNTGWSDLGHPERVMAVLDGVGLKPWWMAGWQAPRRVPAMQVRAVDTSSASYRL
jgi:mannose-1-phosphate guanylyltransferase